MPKIAVSSASYVSGSFLCQRFNGQLALVQMPKSSSKRLLATILAQKGRFQSFFCQRFNNQLGPAQIQLQQAPGHDFAQHGRFHPFLCQRSNNHLELAQMRKSSSKRLRPGFWPKMAVSIFFVSNFHSQVELAQMPKSSSKTLQARIWPKMTVSSFS